MIFKTIVVSLLVIAVCLSLVVVSLLVVDISERHSSKIEITKAESPVVLPPLALSVLPSSDDSYPTKEINYLSHISSSGRVALMDNPNAKDVSYSELMSFLLEDQTDKIPYEENVYSCPDYSQTLQHNAEMKGIQCAWVYVDLLEIIDHSLNAFQTMDRGTIFIDDSGVAVGSTHPYNMDKIVVLSRGQRYCPESLFSESKWNNKWNCTGTIVDYKIYWTGDM